VQADDPQTPEAKKKLLLHVNATVFDEHVAAFVPQALQVPVVLTKYPESHEVDLNPVHVAALVGHLKH
jgi:hypothetical protein